MFLETVHLVTQGKYPYDDHCISSTESAFHLPLRLDV